MTGSSTFFESGSGGQPPHPRDIYEQKKGLVSRFCEVEVKL